MQNTPLEYRNQPVFLITTKRARQLVRYPEEVLRLVDLIGVSHEFAADASIEVRAVIVQMLHDHLAAERTKRIGTMDGYDYGRHMDLADAFMFELTAILLRGNELPAGLYSKLYAVMPKPASLAA